MNKIFANNIARYILKGDTDIDRFEITEFDYRKIFKKKASQNVNYGDILYKIFEIENRWKLDMDQVRSHYKQHQEKWKELFIFFSVMPFTEYEFQGPDGKLVNPDTLSHIVPSHATHNILIDTFSDIEFESFSEEVPEIRLATSLQFILRTDIFSNAFNEEQRNDVITSLLNIGFKQDYNLVTDVLSTDEDTYRINFMEYLFKPICEYVASLLCFEINVRTKNTAGRTGVHTKVPHQSNDLFHSHPDIVAYDKWKHRRSLAVVEVKKLPLLRGLKVINFKDSKIASFFTRVVAEMFSNHANKGILTDSYTTILLEIDIDRSLEVINQKVADFEDSKSLALNYKVLNCHSSGLTLRSGLFSFMYEAFSANDTRMNEIKKGLDAIYKYVRKTDEQYLVYLDGLAFRDETQYRNFCIWVYKNKRQRLFETVIGLGNFKDIDVQSGFTFNSQLFKVSTKDVKQYLKKGVRVDDQLIVKVFDPVKAKRDHDSYTFKKGEMFDECRRAYSREKTVYERLIPNSRFNSIYIDQKCVFGRFNIGEHYHALGPFLILKHLDQTKCPLPFDEETYKKAKEQLDIIHYSNIIHGDISQRNILYSHGKVYFIDFGYSNYDDEEERRSRPVSATDANKKREHRELCEVFKQSIPDKYE